MKRAYLDGHASHYTEAIFVAFGVVVAITLVVAFVRSHNFKNILNIATSVRVSTRAAPASIRLF